MEIQKGGCHGNLELPDDKRFIIFGKKKKKIIGRK